MQQRLDRKSASRHLGWPVTTAALLTALVVAACTQSTSYRAPEVATPPREASAVLTVDAYKRQAAARIMQTNADSVADSLPPILQSVIVLDITVDRDGQPVNVAVRRSNGHIDLERTAIASVRRAQPFPAPSPAVLGGARTVSYVETWLFRPDGRFQLRSVANM
jgi:protein TonB